MSPYYGWSILYRQYFCALITVYLLLLFKEKALRSYSDILLALFLLFTVWCVESIGDIQENSCVYVDEVFKAPNELLCYKIGGSVYPYSNFRISINF